MCWGVGAARDRSVGENGDICNTLNNKEFKLKKNRQSNKELLGQKKRLKKYITTNPAL